MKEKEPVFCPICKKEMHELTAQRATYMCWHCNIQFVKKGENITGYTIDTNGNLKKMYTVVEGKVFKASEAPQRGSMATHNSRAVQQIDLLTGAVIKEFYSIADASRTIGQSTSYIGKCCNGANPKSGGFTWRYADAKG